MTKNLLSICTAMLMVMLAGCQDETQLNVKPQEEHGDPVVEEPDDPNQETTKPVIRCDDDDQNIVSCIDDECTLKKECENGCKNGKCQTAQGSTCGEIGSMRCSEDGQALEICGEDGEWTIDEPCAQGCDESSLSCTPECMTGAQKCDETGQKTLVCRNNSWTEGETCENGCENDACIVNCDVEGALTCQDNALAECHQDWKVIETCTIGCDNVLKRCKPECASAGETACDEDGSLKTCQADFTWQKTTCDNGCYTNHDGTSLCKGNCKTSGEVRCSGSSIETCSESYQWEVTTENCPSGCDNGSCKGCQTKGEVSCNADGNVQTCQSDFTWKQTETCENGCFDGQCKTCGKAGSLSCNQAGNVQTCQSDGTTKETKICENGCFANETTAYCKTCTDIGSSGCSTNKVDILTCTDYHLVKTQTCDIACKRVSGGTPYCAECEAEGTYCSEDGKSVIACSENLKKTMTSCPKGCSNGKCTDGIALSDFSCNSGGNLQAKNSANAYVEVMKCQFGCSNGQCKQCSTSTDCKTNWGMSEGTCNAGFCESTKCKGLYGLIGKTCAHQMPFAGNGYVTKMNGDAYNNYTIIKRDGTLDKWNKLDAKLSFYMYVKAAGPLKLYFKGNLPSGTTKSTITFTYNGMSYDVTLNSTTSKFYEVGTWNVSKAGHVKIDIEAKSVTPTNAVIANISQIWPTGAAVNEMPIAANMETAADETTLNYHRRGPYGDFNYVFPSEDVEWFYNEVMVPAGSDIPGTYYMLCGSSQSYMGIQKLTDGSGTVLFSVWGSKENNSQENPLTILKLGSEVTKHGYFGNEGSGQQIFMDYDWKVGKTYKGLVGIRPNGDGSTHYEAFFGDENGKWHLLGIVNRPNYSSYYKSPYSFIENFNGASGFAERSVYFGNQWARTKAGVWKEITKVTFRDGTGRTVDTRMDRLGKVDGKRLMTKICGYFDGGVDGKTSLSMTRTSSGSSAQPNIDFTALEKLN